MKKNKKNKKNVARRSESNRHAEILNEKFQNVIQTWTNRRTDGFAVHVVTEGGKTEATILNVDGSLPFRVSLSGRKLRTLFRVLAKHYSGRDNTLYLRHT